jgi:hypothetical protein
MVTEPATFWLVATASPCAPILWGAKGYHGILFILNLYCVRICTALLLSIYIWIWNLKKMPEVPVCWQWQTIEIFFRGNQYIKNKNILVMFDQKYFKINFLICFVSENIFSSYIVKCRFWFALSWYIARVLVELFCHFILSFIRFIYSRLSLAKLWNAFDFPPILGTMFVLLLILVLNTTAEKVLVVDLTYVWVLPSSDLYLHASWLVTFTVLRNFCRGIPIMHWYYWVCFQLLTVLILDVF